MVYHTRSKGTPLPTKNRKGYSKLTDAEVVIKVIDKKYHSNMLVSKLEQKIKKLEEENSGMREWAKMLLSANPTLETNMDKQPITSQATFQNNPPPTHPTSYPQNRPSSIHMPTMNTHFSKHPYAPQHQAYVSRPPYLTPCLQSPTIQAHQYQAHLLHVLWYCAPLIPYQIPPYQMPSYQKPTYPVQNVKTLTQKFVQC
ncbi:hypothetical protein KY284_030335 [Solanum tuberosum]|nr:hypothetical protein KY284_030335 [Solanum tuberosum]